ncbi:hypothetical protein HDE_12892 [Halotydeus destructor]|nr:hypothetical protein HDE_12892 [Halotydeus destructor]
MVIKVLLIVPFLIALTYSASLSGRQVYTWFDNVFKLEYANQTYDLNDNVTQYDEDYLRGRSNETYPLFKLSNVTVNISGKNFPGDVMVLESLTEGIHLLILHLPIQVYYRVVSQGDAYTPPFAICGSYGRSLSLNFYRPPDGRAELTPDGAWMTELDSESMGYYYESNSSTYALQSFNVCSDSQDNREEEIKSALDMRSFPDRVEPLVVRHIRETIELSTHNSIMADIDDLINLHSS